MRTRIRKLLIWLVAILLAIAVIATLFLLYQGKREPAGTPAYVALGSSFAAGAGLGPLQSGSPLACARSIGGYPPQLARLRRMDIVDMSCGGAVTEHLLHGGQFFQGAQLRVITPATRLVTITIGGNDVGYVGDLSMLAARNTDSLFGWSVRKAWSGPKTSRERDFPKLYRQLTTLLANIRQRAPKARIVLATYPTILPNEGSCARLSLSPAEAASMRQVGEMLAETTRAAAKSSGVLLVDMNELGRAHNACAATPWVRGWTNGGVAPFHPTDEGARATAQDIAKALGGSPD